MRFLTPLGCAAFPPLRYPIPSRSAWPGSRSRSPRRRRTTQRAQLRQTRPPKRSPVAGPHRQSGAATLCSPPRWLYFGREPSGRAQPSTSARAAIIVAGHSLAIRWTRHSGDLLPPPGPTSPLPPATAYPAFPGAVEAANAAESSGREVRPASPWSRTKYAPVSKHGLEEPRAAPWTAGQPPDRLYEEKPPAFRAIRSRGRGPLLRPGV